MNQSVVVGFDDTEHSAGAIEYAVAEAIARQAPLRLVHAYRWIPVSATPGVPLDAAPMEDVRKAITAMLDEAAQSVRDEHPGLVVETRPMQGDPPRMLADASRDASLLVVGGRGSGGFTGLLLGSVALRVLAMAECPVMMVRGGKASNVGRVMVGVDLLSEQKSTAAVEFAFAEAQLRGVELSALNVWEDPYVSLGSFARLSRESFAAFEDLQRADLAATLEPAQQKYPDVTVADQRAVPGTLSQMLVDATRLADVLVIGGDARDGKRAGMRIGALAHIVLHHAHCPVIVVPEH